MQLRGNTPTKQQRHSQNFKILNIITLTNGLLATSWSELRSYN